LFVVTVIKVMITMHKCDNENDNEGNGTDDNCNVADDVINDELDFQWL